MEIREYLPLTAVAWYVDAWYQWLDVQSIVAEFIELLSMTMITLTRFTSNKVTHDEQQIDISNNFHR